MSVLKQSFYFIPAKQLAQNLLGRYIVRKIGKRELVGKIVETEAYLGPEDKAAHSYRGRKTLRNHILFHPGGYVYIYLVYGMYWQFNITSRKDNKPECVLIRALEPMQGVKDGTDIKNLANGPGKLARWLRLNKSFYGQPLFVKKNLWLEEGDKIPLSKIISAPRVGIDYAQEWAPKRLRFYIKDNIFISKK